MVLFLTIIYGRKNTIYRCNNQYKNALRNLVFQGTDQQGSNPSFKRFEYIIQTIAFDHQHGRK